MNVRIQRPSRRSVFTTLKDCEPPQTYIIARLGPWLGQSDDVVDRRVNLTEAKREINHAHLLRRPNLSNG